MATKRYNKQNFHIEVAENKTLSFYCWTTDTRNGFCHSCWCVDNDKTTKVSYSNRTWESYTYQTVLLKAFDKLPKEQREICRHWDDVKVNGEHEKAEAFVNAFKAVYDATPQSVKDRLAKSDIMLENEEQAKQLMGVMQIATLIEK